MEYVKYKEVAYKLWCTNDIKKVIPVINPNKIKEYNEIKVEWCNTCKSLKIMNCDTELNKDITCYCGNCYSTEIAEGTIEDWEKEINRIK